MSSTHDVISALLDDRPFDPEELTQALSEPSGRALLIDLVVLRRIVQPTDSTPPVRWQIPCGGAHGGSPQPPRWCLLLSAVGTWPASAAP